VILFFLSPGPLLGKTEVCGAAVLLRLPGVYYGGYTQGVVGCTYPGGVYASLPTRVVYMPLYLPGWCIRVLHTRVVYPGATYPGGVWSVHTRVGMVGTYPGGGWEAHIPGW